MNANDFKLSVDVVVVGQESRLAKIKGVRANGQEIKVEGRWIPARSARYARPCNNAFEG